jgi:hypothetical protein
MESVHHTAQDHPHPPRQRNCIRDTSLPISCIPHSKRGFHHNCFEGLVAIKCPCSRQGEVSVFDMSPTILSLRLRATPPSILIQPSYFSFPNGGNRGAVVLSHEYCTKYGDSAGASSPRMTVPSGAVRRNPKFPAPPPLAKSKRMG